jgi:hypothetical protein
MRCSQVNNGVSQIYFIFTPLDPCGPKLQGDGKEYQAILHAHASLESFILHLMHPNKSSIKFAHHLLQMGGGGNNSCTTVKNFAFLYRSFMCRQYIWNELMDALELPKPNHGGIRSMIAYWMTWVVLMLFQMYVTYNAIIVVSKICIIMSCHVNLLMKFETMWRKNHKEQMVKVEQSIMLEAKNIANFKADEELFCPFGLVMSPTTTDNNDDGNVLFEDHGKVD